MNAEFYNKQKVCKIIEDYCRQHRIKKSEFATLIDVHQSHLPRIISGEMASFEVLCKIAVLGNISLNELLNEIPAKVKLELQKAGKLNNIPVAV